MKRRTMLKLTGLPLLQRFMAFAQTTSMDERIDAIIRQLTLEEKVSFVHAYRFMETGKLERLKIPSSQMIDGPCGASLFRFGTTSTYFPKPTCVASTWDDELLRQVGAAMGAETKSFHGDFVLLAPMINIIRHPFGGRDFEAYSEDPFLTGSLAVAFVRGLQSEDVGACPKHIACNNQEKGRKGIDVIVDDRTLREVYLLQFQMVVQQADPVLFMTGYNKINGTYCYMDKNLLTDIARGEWGYKGAFCSDWTAVRDAIAAVEAGLDFDSNGPWSPEHPDAPPHGAYARDLVRLVHEGKLKEEQIDPLVHRVLRIYFRTGLMDGKERKGERNTKAHAQLARRIAEEGIVLLKNDGILPLHAAELKRIAMFGPNAERLHGGRGGSSYILAPYEISPFAGLTQRLGGRVAISYVRFEDGLELVGGEHLKCDVNGSMSPGLCGEYFSGAEIGGTPVLKRLDSQLLFNWLDQSPAPARIPADQFAAQWTGRLLPPETGLYELSITTSGKYRIWVGGRVVLEGTGAVRSESSNPVITLTQGQAVDLRVEFVKQSPYADVALYWKRPGDREARIAEAARQADVALLILGTSHDDENEGKDRTFWNTPEDQVALLRTVAQENSRTVVVMVNGAPLEMASWEHLSQAIVEAWYAGQEGGLALCDILTGDVNPSGKLTETFPRRIEDVASYGNYPGENGRVEYKEGIFVGYRHFDKNKLQPLYPFGHGLSYTTFAYRHGKISRRVLEGDQTLTASFDLTNTGARAGAEIAQLYVTDVKSRLPRPLKEFKGYRKVHLEPGQTQRVAFTVDRSLLQYYDPERKAWIAEPGRFELLIGRSSQDLKIKLAFEYR